MSLYHTSVMSNIADYVNEEPLAKKGFQIYDLGTIIDTKHGKIMLEEYDPKERKYSVKKLVKSGNIWENVDVKVKEETIYECIENDDWVIQQLNETPEDEQRNETPNDRNTYDKLVDDIVESYQKLIGDKNYHSVEEFNGLLDHTFELIARQHTKIVDDKDCKVIPEASMRNAYETIWEYAVNNKSNLYINGKQFNFEHATDVARTSLQIIDRSRKSTLFSDDYDLDNDEDLIQKDQDDKRK